MDDENKVGDDTSVEETADNSASTEEQDGNGSSTEETAEDAEKLKELAENYKIRAQKAERELKAFKSKPSKSAEIDDEDLDKKVTERFEKRDLESMEYPDDIKTVISQVAKINNVSVRKAVSDPYVSAKIESWKKTKEAEEASISRNNKTGKAVSSDDPNNPPKVDFNTPEGRKEYDDWKARLIKKGY